MASPQNIVMNRDQERATVEGYCIQILIVNGEVLGQSSQKSLYIENIGKGGFRFVSDVKFDLEDRVQVLLRFPDGFSQEVLGRICYTDPIDTINAAYGFSVIEGFYTLGESHAC